MENFSKAKKLTYFAVLTALTVVLQLVGNTVRIGVVTLNFSLVPIVLCGILLGVWYGTALGAITGLIILLHGGILGADGFTNVLFATDPVIITLVCIVKTAAAGAVSAILFNVIKRRNGYAAIFTASGIVPVVNSGLFILGMLCIVPSLYNAGFLTEGSNAFAGIVIGFVGLNFVFEFAVNLIVAPALYRVICIVDKSFDKFRRERTETSGDKSPEENSDSGARFDDNSASENNANAQNKDL
ncbi:MAG: ECF transporter S component [Clostridia bacterium]|nr:ECF transporter S component [Clostridia bacterium]